MRLRLIIFAVLILTACDKPHVSETAPDWSPWISWDESSRAFLLDGERLLPARSWDFARQPMGLAAVNAELEVVQGQGLRVHGAAPDPSIRITSGLGLRGAEAGLILVRLTRISGAGGWDGSVYYVTSHHGESPNYRKAAPQVPRLNEPVVAVYDMTQLTIGGDDWRSSTIRAIRLDLGANGGGEVVIHQIAIVPLPD